MGQVVERVPSYFCDSYGRYRRAAMAKSAFRCLQNTGKTSASRWREREKAKRERQRKNYLPFYSLGSFTLYEDTHLHSALCFCLLAFYPSRPSVLFYLIFISFYFDTEFIVIPDSLRVAYTASSLPIATDSALPYPCATGSGFPFQSGDREISICISN